MNALTNSFKRLQSRPAWMWIGIPLVLLITLVAAFALWPRGAKPDTHAEDEHTEEETHHAEDEARHVELTSQEIEELGIEVLEAGPGELRIEKRLPGEVQANRDRYAHVTPRVEGIVRTVRVDLGDHVRAGQTVAVIESRELADLKAAYLAALEREELEQARFDRQNRLFEQKITSEQDFLDARQSLAEAQIDVRSARQKLRALGFSEATVRTLPNESEAALVTYPLTTSISGEVVEKHIVPGETVGPGTAVLEVANLSTVWVDFTVYQDDLDLIRNGMEVVVDAGEFRRRGTISYVRPVVGEETRTALARVVVDNGEGLLRPGQFVSGIVSVGTIERDIVVPESAVLDIDGETAVFVATSDGFEARFVRLGDRADSLVAVESGLDAGIRYVSTNGFALKAELEKGEISAGHAH